MATHDKESPSTLNQQQSTQVDLVQRTKFISEIIPLVEEVDAIYFEKLEDGEQKDLLKFLIKLTL